MCFLTTEIVVYSLRRANIIIKPFQSAMALYSSTQVRSEQTGLVWLRAERSMLIFVLWW